MLNGFSSGVALSATADQVLIKSSDVVTYRDVPGAKFSPDVGRKYTINSAGVLGQQGTVFGTMEKRGFIALPDGLGGTPGEGFTCTGLAWDGSAFWVANDGRADEPDVSFEPSAVRVSLAGVKLSEIALQAALGWTSGNSPQGIAYDSSNASLWIAGADAVYHMTAAGVNLSDGFALASVNGICYDSLRDCLWCGAGTTLTRRSKAGAVLNTYTVTGGIDQMHYDALRDYVWYTTGINGVAGQAYAHKASDGTEQGIATFPDAMAIEGIVIVSGNFYIAHDGFFHTEAPIRKNQIQIYPTVSGSHTANWARDFNPATGAVLGYQFETALTILCDRNRELSTLAWGKNNCTGLTDTVTGPDGILQADTLVASAGTFSSFCNHAVASVAGGAIQGIFAKKGTYRYLWLGDRNNSAGRRSATYDLQTGTVIGQATGTVAEIVALADGWYFCGTQYTRSDTGTGSLNVGFGDSVHADEVPTKTWLGTETLYLWGAQPANESFRTSPLVGDLIQGTRTADAPTLATSAFDWSATNNSITFEARTARGAGTQTLWQAGTAADGMKLFRNSSNEIHFLVTVGSVTQADLNLGTVANNTAFKVAVRAKANDFSGSLNGAAVVTDVSGTLPTVTITRMGHSAAGEQWNGWVKSWMCIPQALTDAALILKAT